MRHLNVRRSGYLLVGAMLLVLAPQLLTGQSLPERPGGKRPIQLSKPRIAPLPENKFTDLHKQLVARYLPAGARPGNGFRTILAISPELIENTMTTYNYVTRDSSVPPRHKSIIILRTAWDHGSDVLWRENLAAARRAGLTDAEIKRIAQGPDTPGWDPFEANLMRVADQLFRNSFVNDKEFNAIKARSGGCYVMDVGLTIADIASMSLLYNTMGVQPDDAPPSDRMPLDVPYQINVPARETITLKAPRLEPLPPPGNNNTRMYSICPPLAAARNGSGYVLGNKSRLVAEKLENHREFLIVRTGWDSQSEYEWSEHVGEVGRARERGLPIDKIAQGPNAPGLDPFEATLMRVADELYRDCIVSDQTWAALSPTYDDRKKVDATISAANYRQVSLALNILGVQINPGGERLPPVPK